MTDEELTRRFDGIREEFVRTREDFEAVVRAEHAETRTHFDVVAEEMRADIRKIAEGHGTLQQNVAALTVRQNQLEQRQDTLEVRQGALEFRQRKLDDE